MCTCGALSVRRADGRLVCYLVKTSDSDFIPHWHGQMRSDCQRSVLSFGLLPQGGVNAGVNDAGLALLMSFLDYRVAPNGFSETVDKLTGRWVDDRGLVNAALLSRCASVEEGIDFLYQAVRARPEIVGGSYFLTDQSGAIAVFEHCDGKVDHRTYANGGVESRGNDGLLIWQLEQDRLPEPVKEDRQHRRERMAQGLSALRRAILTGLADEQVEKGLQAVLACHGVDGPEGIGSICAHGVTVQGARSWASSPCWTIGGVILNVAGRRMTYSVGNPCLGRWRSLEFDTQDRVGRG